MKISKIIEFVVVVIGLLLLAWVINSVLDIGMDPLHDRQAHPLNFFELMLFGR